MAQVIKNRIFKIILFTLLGIVLLPVVAYILLQFSNVQTFLVNKITSDLNEGSDFVYSIDRVSISWFDEAVIDSVKIIDPAGNEMITVDEVLMDFNVWDLISGDSFSQDLIVLEHPKFQIRFIEVDTLVTLNINHFRRQFTLTPDTTKKAKPIKINEIFIKDGTFNYDNVYRDPLAAGFDPNHFEFAEISTTLQDLRVENNVVDMEIIDFSTRETEIDALIDPLNAHFRLSPNEMLFTDLEIATGQSVLRDSLSFQFERMYDFNDFYNKIQVTGHLNNSVIDHDDLKKFFPQVTRFPAYARISGHLEGKMAQFNVTELDILFGKKSHLLGSFSMSGLPVINEAFINIDLKNSELTIEDLEPITRISHEKLPDPGKMLLNARFLGFPGDFVAVGKAQTEYGYMESDLNLKLPENSLPEYSGTLLLRDFDIGSMTQTEDLGSISFNGKIDGKGFRIAEADLTVEGNIEKLEYKDYTYTKIYSDGQLASEYFNGLLSIDDPNIKFNLEGQINLAEKEEYLDFTATLDTLNALELGWTKEKLTVQGNGTINFQGLNPDEIIGSTRLYDIRLERDSSKLNIDSVYVTSDIQDEGRSISLQSELVKGKIDGQFLPSKLFSEFDYLYRNYKAKFLNDTTFLTSPLTDTTVNKFDYEVEILTLNPLFELFVPGLTVSDSTFITGTFNGGKTKIFNLFTESDSIRYKEYTFSNNLFEINSSMNQDREVLAMLYIQSDRQTRKRLEAQDLLVEAIWDAQHIDFDINLDQHQFNNTLHVEGELNFKKDSTEIRLAQSEINILSKPWKIDSKSNILFTQGEVWVNDFAATSAGEGLFIDGALSKDPTKDLYVEFDSLQLENFNSLINKELRGKLNGDMTVVSFFDNTSIENELTITKLFINEFKVGDAFGGIQWDKNNKRFDLKFTVNYEGVDNMDLDGYYDPLADSPLNIDATLINARVNILEPFIGGYFSELSGTATGGFKITGTLNQPRIDGTGELRDGEMKINYLNTTYFMTGRFDFSEDKIFLQNIDVKDNFGNGGTLQGEIDHGGFKDMKVNLGGEFTNIMVLNTGPKDNSLFYGTAFATGDIQFLGPVDKLTISANARSEKETKIYIPIEGTETVETREYISFVDFSDSSKVEKEKVEFLDLKGVLLDMNLDITPDAYCEIIFDIKAGDIIRGRGNGDLNLKIDTNGEFNMFGSLAIQEGWYNFTLYNLINKEFSITPGGVINWYGDPYAGVMDLVATYNQTASLAPILEPPFNTYQEVSRKFPTQVLMNLDGPLLNPEIKFDITTTDLPKNLQINGEGAVSTLDMDFEFQKFKNRSDEQELKRQVFSLIVLRRFSPPESFNTGGAISNSVSELFSNQLSYWMSQVDNNLEVDFDVDLNAFDEEAFNTFQLRLSYAFLDGRLRVTRDGSITDNERQVNLTSLAGNWTVEYLLSQDGKMKVKMYSKNNFDNVNLPDRNNTSTTGFSLQYTQSFNEFFKEMGRIFRKNNSSPPVPPAKDNSQSFNNDAIREENENESGNE